MWPANTRGGLRRGAAFVLVAILVVLVIVIAAIIPGCLRAHEREFAGLWTGDPQFLDESGLSDMYMYVAPCPAKSVGGSHTHKGYLVMVDLDGEFVSNQTLVITCRRAPARWWSALRAHFGDGRPYAADADIKYGEEYDEAFTAIPARLRYTIRDGRLTLHNGEKMYAFLNRDASASEAANSEYTAAGENGPPGEGEQPIDGRGDSIPSFAAA